MCVSPDSVIDSKTIFIKLQKMGTKVKAGKVNCDVERNLCQNLGIDGYPTVRVYSGSENSQQSQVRNAIL